MQVNYANVITVTDPSAALSLWCKQHLVLQNPAYTKKRRMGFWVGNTPKEILLYEVKGNQLILPYGCLVQITPMLQGDVTFDFPKPQRVDYGAVTGLYDYQQKAVAAAQVRGHGILIAPCGSGKTEMAIALTKRLGRKTLFLAHTLDLIKQAKERAILRGIDPALIGTITEGKVHIGEGITFATVQTLSKLDLRQYAYEWDVIITDECHHLSGSPTTLTMYYKVLSQLKARYKYGLTATLHRADGLEKGVVALVGEVAYEVPKQEVNTLPVSIQAVMTGIPLSRDALNTDGTLNFTKLTAYLTGNLLRNICITNRIIENAGKSCLILSDRLEHLESLMKRLPPDMQKDAVMISGKMTSKTGKAERERAQNDMRTGEKKYLFATWQLAKEGLDIPCLERLFMATPKKDYTAVTQAVGRIARPYAGKGEPVCYDFVDDFGYAVKLYRQRLRHYKKAGCPLLGEITPQS